MADHICQKQVSGVRAKLYVAALTASRWNKQAKAIYERLVAKGKAKKAALGAVMRKLVHLCFGVLKTRLPWMKLCSYRLTFKTVATRRGGPVNITSPGNMH